MQISQCQLLNALPPAVIFVWGVVWPNPKTVDRPAHFLTLVTPHIHTTQRHAPSACPFGDPLQPAAALVTMSACRLCGLTLLVAAWQAASCWFSIMLSDFCHSFVVLTLDFELSTSVGRVGGHDVSLSWTRRSCVAVRSQRLKLSCLSQAVLFSGCAQRCCAGHKYCWKLTHSISSGHGAVCSTCMPALTAGSMCVQPGDTQGSCSGSWNNGVDIGFEMLARQFNQQSILNRTDSGVGRLL